MSTRSLVSPHVASASRLLVGSAGRARRRSAERGVVTLEVGREEILGFRRRVGMLDERAPWSSEALRRAAWVGLQDSMPRAAVASIHARVSDTPPNAWEDAAFVQVWGPRYQAYVVPAQDHALFTVARYPDDARGRRVAEETAARVEAHLAGRRMRDREVAGPLGIGNAIRYATTTGTILIRWEGALAPAIWTVPRPDIDPREARLELARRYVHVFGPTTAAAFAKWAGVGAKQAADAFDTLRPELLAVRTPIGEGVLLAEDEPLMRAVPPAAPVRLLPSGDAFWLLWGQDRELLVPDPRLRDELWTSRVWPGALLLAGDIAGTWRRAGVTFSIDPWRSLTAGEREAIEAEAATLPIPGTDGRISVTWSA